MITIASPVSTACRANSSGARNMKVNSIGSVTPVRNAVRAMRQQHAAHAPCAARAGRSRYMARHAAGRPNIITGKKPAMKAPGGRVAGEEAVQVAGGAVIVAEDEPDHVVEDVVQAGDDQQPVEQAVGEQAERPGADDGVAEPVDAPLERRPAEAEHEREHQARQRR